MPIYEYACDACKIKFEVEQSMQEEPLTVCPKCSGTIRRVFSPSSIIFKGSGFYANDSRPQKEEKVSSQS
ncbi:MAG: FmdB family zinc ribbon protein [Sphaerochaetaceae bacterium]|jgi:putative FmdB family regulatory protein|nr:zinc ribbon domain-containing protein [Sphaerochaetaceae bacterium]HHU88960.1 FmdB family transcriptional regulator [Spirochaetales bacterium]